MNGLKVTAMLHIPDLVPFTQNYYVNKPNFLLELLATFGKFYL